MITSFNLFTFIYRISLPISLRSVDSIPLSFPKNFPYI